MSGNKCIKRRYVGNETKWSMKEDMSEVKQEITVMKEDMEVKQEINVLKGDMSEVKQKWL